MVKVKVTQSCLTLCDPMDYTVHGILQARILEWVAFPFLLQGIFPTQGSNPGLQHCGHILYQLSYQGSPRILEWVAYPFSRGSSWPRNWTGASCIVDGFFTNWAIRETRNSSWKQTQKTSSLQFIFSSAKTTVLGAQQSFHQYDFWSSFIQSTFSEHKL